jgi:hypothetical protein
MWTIKTVEVWLSGTNITWVNEGEWGMTRRLDVYVAQDWMTVSASLNYQGKELVIKRLSLERATDNLWFLDDSGMEVAFGRAMNEGH